MKPGKLEPWLYKLHAKECTFDQFVTATWLDWAHLGTTLINRWSGHGLDLGDVVAIFLQSVLEFLPRFDPTRSSNPARYVIWNGCVAVKRRIHALRGVSLSGSPGKKPSPIVYSVDDVESSAYALTRGQKCSARQFEFFDDSSEEPFQFTIDDWRRVASAIPAQLQPVPREFERAHGDFSEMYAALNKDSDFLLQNRIGSDDDLRRAVRAAFSFMAMVE